MADLATDSIVAIRSVGGLLPADLLERIAFGLGGRSTAIADLDGLKAEHYHLVGETLREAATQAWSRLTGAWQTFSDGLGKLPDDDPALAQTRERWLLPLFSMLGYGRLERTGTLTVDGKDFPISHQWRDVPIHLLGWNVELERKTSGVPGAATAAPTSLVQELLNRSDSHLWGMVSNGRRVLLLRDSTSLVRSSFVEFDLEAIFSGELFSEFLLLFTLLHQSRFERLGEDSGPSDCWAERWRTHSLESGARALELLKPGVVAAINRLGTGFVRHPANIDLRETLRTVRGYEDAFHRALLRLVYRLLFVFVIEDRKNALHSPDATVQARQRYSDYFSTARLRAAARRRVGDRHGDRWQALRLVFRALGGEFDPDGLPQLGLPALGGIFEPGELDKVLGGCQLSNADLLAAVRAMSIVDTGSGPSRPVDYKGLDSEELGSVYESLLEYEPKHDPDDMSFELRKLPGNERKTTGSYYTPSSLIECLLDSALEPVLDNAVKDKATAQEQENALLEVTVCDPACGSGHFLVAAARRIAKRLAVVRTGDPEPPESAVRHALHDVIGRCIYGVDINPLAIELAKVSLWLEALEPGRPLDFLDAHLKVGNSLLGVTPKLLDEGIPDTAFKPLGDDDPTISKGLLAQNAAERSRQGDLFGGDGLTVTNVVFAQTEQEIFARPAARLEDVQVQATRYRQFRESPELERRLQAANAWCAAFVWRKEGDAPPAVTQQTLFDLDADPDSVPWMTREEIARLTRDYRFFHWHLEFPEIFAVGGTELSDVDPRTGWSGGFSCVLGNPPWERVKLQEKEFFATRNEEIARARNAAARTELIDKLATSKDETERALHEEFIAARREADGTARLLRDSGRFPLTGRGDVNTYPVFAETAQTIISGAGFFGMILPTGIATDATTQYFFRNLVDTTTLASFFDFENEAYLLSREVHHSVHFSLLTVAGRHIRIERSRFAFYIRYMHDLEPRMFEMRPSEILLLNPNTGTCPVFRTRRDAEITLDIYRRVPILIRENDLNGNPWGVSFMAMFHMAGDSRLFRTQHDLESEGWILKGNVFARDDDVMLPLYEAKMVHHYDHRLGTYEGQTQAQANMGTLPRLSPEQHEDADFAPLPRYWVSSSEVDVRFAERWNREWIVAFRDICRTTDERTTICAVLPRAAVGHVLPILIPSIGFEVLPTMLCSFAFDYIARQKLGGSTHLTYGYLKQLPIITPQTAFSPTPWYGDIEFASWCRPRVVELSSSSWEMRSFARDLGYEGPPFLWNEGRRELLRAELDAAYFHLYGIRRDDVDYIMDTFPVVKRRDEAKFGDYRTKRLILETYDAMLRAIDTGEPYRTVLKPPPGEGPRHPAR